MNNILRMFVVALAVLFSGVASAASAVTVQVLPGQFVGLTSAGYWAGVYMLDINGTKMLAMDDISPWYGLTSSPPFASIPPWYTDGSSWTANLYTQDDIMAGATVLSTSNPAAYSKAAELFVPGLLGYNPADPLWTAGFNEMVMNTTPSLLLPPVWSYASQVYDTSAGTTLLDVYKSMLPNLDPNYNYRGKMLVLSNITSDGTNPRVAEFLVLAAPVPVPPAIWLFGSGLLGLVGIARRKRS